MRDEDGQVDNLIADYLQMIDEGADVDAKEFIAGYPTEIRNAFLDYLQWEKEIYLLNGLGGSGQRPVSRVAESRTDEVVGRFRLANVISQGGMGIVYVGQDIQSGDLVAIKLLHRTIQNQRSYQRRLERESRAIAALNHPHVVKPIASGADEGSTYLAMQLIDGIGLERIIQYWHQVSSGGQQDNRPSTVDDHHITTPITHAEVSVCAAFFEKNRLTKIAELLANIADALHAAHQNGIVHRDVKPSNILIDVRGDIWLTDFGLASMGEDETELTETGDVLGTPAYMSPEQASGKSRQIDRFSDIYSLGVTLYELATFNKPFLGTRQKILHDLLEGRFVRPSKAQPEVPSELEAIICQAMELEPRDRYQTAKEFAADLRRFVDRDRVRARGRSKIQEAIRWCERNPLTTTVAVAGCILATIVAFSVQAMNSWSLTNLNTQLNSANEQLIGVNRDLDASQARLRRELYVANMRSAYEAFNDQDLTSTQLLLGPYRGSGVDVPRSIPQRLLEALIEPPTSQVLCQHEGSAKKLVVADDFSFVLSAGHDGQVIKSTLDGNELARFSIGGKLDSLALDAGAKVFLTGRNIPSGFNEVDFYGLANGQIQQTGCKLWYGVEETAVSQSGNWFAAAERYHDIVVFDNEGNEHARWTTDSRNESLEFADDEHLLGIVQVNKSDRELHVLDLKSGEKRQLATEVECFALSRDTTGKPLYILAAGTNDLQVCRWPEAKRTRYANDMPSRIRCVDISTNDNCIVAGCDDGTVYIWEADLEDDSELPKARIVAVNTHRISDIKLLPSADKLANIDSASGLGPAPMLRFLTTSEDGTVQLHSLPTTNPKSVQELENESRGAIEEPFRDPRRTHLLYLPYANGELVCLDAMTLEASTVFRHHAPITRGLCADDTIFIAGADGIVEIDREGYIPRRTFPSPLPRQNCRSLLKIGNILFALYSGDLVSIDLGDGAEQQVHDLPYDDAIGLAASPSESASLQVFTHRAILELGTDGQLRTINLNDSIKEAYIKVQDSRNQEMQAIARHSDQIEVTSLKTHAKWTLSGHRHGVSDLEFIDDEMTLMSVSLDGTLRFWSLETEREYGRLELAAFAPHYVHYFRDQSLIVAVNYLGKVRAWRLASKN